jgi:hypothetical protein
MTKSPALFGKTDLSSFYGETDDLEPLPTGIVLAGQGLKIFLAAPVVLGMFAPEMSYGKKVGAGLALAFAGFIVNFGTGLLVVASTPK